MEITHHTLIKKELWDAARWRGTAFLHAPGEQPGMALLFEDIEAARILFADLRAQLGEGDRNEHLRVSIINGTRRDGLVGYTVRFGVNPIGLIGDGSGTCYTFSYARSRFMETGGKNSQMETFRKDYELHGMYFIVPLGIDNPEVDLTHMIGKVGIFFRDFSELTPDDLDGDIEGS